MRAVKTRSGLVESIHQVSIAGCDPSGGLIFGSGDLDRPFYLRSSAKPFQVLVAEEAGASLTRIHLALAASSHDGDPVHLAVESMLAEVGLDESSLLCPPAWPLGSEARDILVRAGHRRPRRIFHDCSGKHVGWLRACVAQGWPTESYLAPDHPLQIRILDLVSELGSYPVEPVGVDGCGAPVLRTTVLAMARMYARLGNDERFDKVFSAMHSYPALVSGTGNGDAVIATALNAVAKRGAVGCLGVAVRGGPGIAVKSWDGSEEIATAAMVRALEEMPGWSAYQSQTMASLIRPVLGGGEPVGGIEVDLETSDR